MKISEMRKAQEAIKRLPEATRLKLAKHLEIITMNFGEVNGELLELFGHGVDDAGIVHEAVNSIEVEVIECLTNALEE